MGITKQERIDKAFKAIYNTPISDTSLGISNYENQHTQWLITKYPGFVAYFDVTYNFYVNLINSINYVHKSSWEWDRKLPFVYLGNSTFPLYKSFTALRDGFYEESLSLSRVSYELMIKSIFCYIHKENAFTTIQKQKNKPDFNVTHFTEYELKIKNNFLYELASGTTHGKLYFVKRVKEAKENSTHSRIGLQLKLDEKQAQININYLTFLLWANLFLAHKIFVELSPNVIIEKKARKDLSTYIFLLGELLKGTPNGFPNIVKDFTYVFNNLDSMKETIETGEKL